MLARAFVWSGGVVFVASLVFFSWWFAVTLGRTAPVAGTAIAVDAAIFVVFAAHHSVFAREPVKRWMASTVPVELVRSVYVWIASVLFFVVMIFWQPIGGELYHARGVQAAIHVVVQLVGVWMIARAVSAIDPLELAGIHPPGGGGALQVDGVYGWVRHPLYLGWIMATLGAAHMTGDRFAVGVITGAYLAIAVPWEERSLTRSFGDAYLRYQRRVRWRIVPFIY